MKYFQNQNITQLIIPGSHDSFAYHFNLWGPNELNYPTCTNIIIKNWAYTQNYTINQQLLMGIRYLDMRITKEEDEFYTTHNLLSIPLINVLNSVLNFIHEFPTEKIIIDFNHLYLDDKEELKNYIKEKLNGHIINNDIRNLTLPLNQIEEELFIFFNDDVDDDLFFSDDLINSMWHNTNNINVLINEINNEILLNNKLNITQCILTPLQEDILKGLFLFIACPSSLKELTQKHKNKMLNCLYQNIQNKQIIIMDYVDNNFINLCLNENIRRFYN